MEKEPKGQREEAFPYFTAAQALAFEFLLQEMATRGQDFSMPYSCYYSNHSLRVTPSLWILLALARSLWLINPCFSFLKLVFTSFGG